VRISGSNAGYSTFRGRVKGTGYPLQSPVSPSLPLPCVSHRVPLHFNWNLPPNPGKIVQIKPKSTPTICMFNYAIQKAPSPLFIYLSAFYPCRGILAKLHHFKIQHVRTFHVLFYFCYILCCVWARSQNCEKRPLASCLSVCLSVRMEQFGSHWTDMHEDGTDWLCRNVGNYQPNMRNTPEERRSHWHWSEAWNHAAFGPAFCFVQTYCLLNDALSSTDYIASDVG